MSAFAGEIGKPLWNSDLSLFPRPTSIQQRPKDRRWGRLRVKWPPSRMSVSVVGRVRATKQASYEVFLKATPGAAFLFWGRVRDRVATEFSEDERF
jgi:hypothetical protein